MSQCSSEAFSRAILSQRIVYVDSYTSLPIPEVDVVYSQFRGTETKRVPVIRIYGATTKGQKACAHIHGVFPYLYVEHDPKIFNLEQRLASELDREINSTLLDFNSKDAEHVYKIMQVTGRSFYGFKPNSQIFLKILFYSPIALTKAVGLLQSGKILGQFFQPFESHIPYILQFFLDFKLHGMNFIHFTDIKFRGRFERDGKEDEFQFQDLGEGRIDLRKLPFHHFLPAKVLKKSRCEIEFDVTPSDIIIAQSATATGKNPGIEAIWLDEKERRRQNGILDWAEMTIPLSQDRPVDSFIFPREEELLSLLQSKLLTHLESKDLKNELPRTPTPSQDSPCHLLSQTLTPSSQVLIEDVGMINSESPSLGQSMEWDEDDDEMVSLLEDMAAKNRILEDEEVQDQDSIISSQVLADFQNDPFLSFGSEPTETDIDEARGSAHGDKDDEDWERDFLSTSVCQFLDECENKATTLRANDGSGVIKSGKDVRDFKLNQADGQFDSSEEDEDAANFFKSRYKANQSRKSVGLPITGREGRFGKMKSADDFLKKATTFPRSSSSSSLPISPGRSRFRPPEPDSPPMIGSSSDDEEFIPKANAQQKANVANVKILSIQAALRKSLTKSPVVSPNRSRIRPATPPSPPILSSSSSEGEDSDATRYVPSDAETEEKGACNAFNAGESGLPQEATENDKGSKGDGCDDKSSPDICEVPSSQEDGIDSGIRSFYQYPGEEDDLSQIIDEDDSEDEGRKDSQASVNLSIESVYEYSENEDVDGGSTNSEEMDRSFLDVCMTQTQSSSPEILDEEPSEPEDEEKSNFMRKSERSKLKLKEERESHVALKESVCPTPFDWEVMPIKNPPSSEDIEKWIEDKDRAGDFQEDSRQEGPVSLKCFRTKASGLQNVTHCGGRRKMIADILAMRAEIQRIPPPLSSIRLNQEASSSTSRVLPEPEAPVQKSTNLVAPPRVSSAAVCFSDSDSEETPVHSKPFRFGGGNSDGEDELSSEISDNESTANSPVPTPPPTQQQRRKTSRPTTPKSGGWIARKRRRLNWGSQSQEEPQNSQGIRLSLDESELDSISFTSSQSPGAFNSSNYQDVKSLQECQFLKTISMEVHCSARGSLIPDPAEDYIQAIFYSLHNEVLDRECISQGSNFGCLIVDEKRGNGHSELPGSIKTFPDELSMIKDFIRFIQESDPDILVGYEICRFSWGYLVDRGRHLGLDMIAELSRLLPLPYSFGNKSRDPRHQQQWNESISGRIVLNLWRLLRHEMTVTSYTFEKAVFQILHEKVHLLSYRMLADQWETLNQKFKVISYFKRRVLDVIRIIEKLDLINRTSELARLFGIQFFEVLSRGSQFRVESMMLRLAKADNLIPPSPSPQQRGGMKAPEYLPLIMEPESKFYSDPVAVLDFQSLYPSMMMAYNYCYSTCIGRVKTLGEEGSFELGCLSQEISLDELSSLFSHGLIHVSPCGVAFVKESVKKGILSEMLEQILDTRQMVKRSMKKWKDDKTLQKVLDSRQLGLKLIANVTYGYTSANYSGRMPCVDIADSVVSKGRETLQRAIDFVKDNEDRFHARVVYGDTDSLFLHFPGMTRAEAFTLSQKIVEEITAGNPKPVKLKLEKVYQPCILQTKKRYVGYAYETPDQVQPKYDAKGIETVRRDGCPATAQILEGALKVLFVTQEERKVKAFVQEQFRKIFMGRVSLSKYTFAKEYRGRSGYKPTAVVPSLEIAKRLAEKDPRAEPLRSQRVPYIVVYGDPNVPLIQLIRRPEDFIGNSNLRLNAHYYVEKAIIPPLNRCFSLAKMDVSKWYADMPRKYLKSHYVEGGRGGGAKKGTIDQYFVSESCIKCESRTATGFCETCFSNAGEVRDYLNQEEIRISQKFETCMNICHNCSKEDDMTCINMDCPVKYRFLRYDRDYRTRLPKLQSLSQKMNMAMCSW